MGISRTPVREALVRLSEHELVQARPNRGFTVKVFTIKEVEDLYNMCEALEVLAVRLAIQNLDDEKARTIRKLIDGYLPLMEANDLVKFNNVDQTFHDLIAFYSGNSFLTQTLRSLHDQVRIVRRYEHLRAGSFQETYEEHRQIFDHMVLGETTKAKAAMSRHILRSMKVILNFLKDSGY